MLLNKLLSYLRCTGHNLGPPRLTLATADCSQQAFHVCIEVDHVYSAVKDLTSQGLPALGSEPKRESH
ncbi:hypothetical protein IWQ61_009371, partial [Dispira simplex]